MICFICGRDHPRGIGGTAMARILGLVPKTNALDIYHQLTRPHRPETDPETIDQIRGHALEPMAAEHYWAATGRKGRRASGAQTHRNFSAFQIHIDYYIFADPTREKAKRGKAVLELKAPRSPKFGRIIDDGLFQAELIQAFTYGAVCGADWVSLAFFNLEHNEGPIYYVDQILDPAMSNFLLETGQRFWDEHVVPRIEPDPSEWELLAREDAPVLLDLSGELQVITDENAKRIGDAFLDAKELKKEGGDLYTDRGQEMREWMEGETLQRIQIPGSGKFTLVQNKGKVQFEKKSLELARPLDWDLVRAFVIEEGKNRSEDEQDEILEAMSLDLSRFERRGDPFSYVLPTRAKDLG